jgi:hypothetical protein
MLCLQNLFVINLDWLHHGLRKEIIKANRYAIENIAAVPVIKEVRITALNNDNLKFIA